MDNRQELLEAQASYWQQRAEQGLRAADYANGQLRLVFEELGRLGIGAMSETTCHLTLLDGGLSTETP
jgi:hypothetical protein